MKKKVAIVLFLMVGVFCSAQELKFYSDYNTGYRGQAAAKYMGTMKTINYDAHLMQLKALVFSGGDGTRNPFHVSKITEEQSFLMWSALHEYDLRNDEVYDVYILTNTMVIMLAVRMDGKKSVWYDGYGALRY